jgi:putative PIN family toxin of toxin-antitoxin system
VKAILDTNVFISGVFFGGPPGKILQGWGDGRFTLVLSPEILEEYQRVAEVLSKKYPPIDLTELLELIVVEADMIQAKPLNEPVSADPDDDMFIACALASGARLIVSGDKHLLDVDGYSGIEVLKPKAFVDRHLLN